MLSKVCVVDSVRPPNIDDWRIELSQANFQKQQREKARREKAAAKFARREERKAEQALAEPPTSSDDEATLLAELADLHTRYDAGGMSFDDFEVARTELSERLSVM